VGKTTAQKSRRSFKKLQITREGKFFIGITLGIGLAAMNTGNNLLYLLLGWLLSLLIISGILSNLTLRAIEIVRTAPKRVHANHPFAMEIRAKNKKRRFASYVFHVEDLCEREQEGKTCYFFKLPEGKTQTATYRHTLHKRGHYVFDRVRISTTFPFGFFIKSKQLSLRTEILVYPATHAVSLPAPRGHHAGTNTRPCAGRSGEFFGLREYREGDERRAIHWRSSASKQTLLVREYEDQSQRQITLILDNALPDPHGEKELEALEKAIILCASLAKSYIEKGYMLQFFTRDIALPYATGPAQLESVFRTLAMLCVAHDDTSFSPSLTPVGESVMVVPAQIPAQQRPKHVHHVVSAQG